MSDGPDTPATDTAAAVDSPGEVLDLEGFEEAISGYGHPDPDDGQPEQTDAVDEGEAEETPEVGDTDTESEETPPEDDATEVESEAEHEVNFDGFSDAQRTTWERLLKAGHASAEEVETARLESLFQSAYTKKTMADAEARRAWEKEVAERREDLELLDSIRGDPALHARWLRMSEADDSSEESDGDDLVDRKSAEQIFNEMQEKREAERQARLDQDRERLETWQKSIHDAVQESMKTLDVTPDQMKAYLEAEEATMPEGTDLVARLTPEDLQDRLVRRHELESAKAEAAQLREQLSKKTSKGARTSKQSQPPARRVSNSGKMSPLEQTEADLNLDHDWSNVTGLGHAG